MTVGSMIALRLCARLAAAKYLSAIHLAVLDICHNSVELPFIQHGPDLRAFIPRVADLKVADFADKGSNKFFLAQEIAAINQHFDFKYSE